MREPERRPSAPPPPDVAGTMALAGVLSQAGCMTLLIILAAMGVGLFLDARFQSRPMFTLTLVLGSIPLTIFLMVRIAIAGTARAQQQAREAQAKREEDERAKVP